MYNLSTTIAIGNEMMLSSTNTDNTYTHTSADSASADAYSAGAYAASSDAYSAGAYDAYAYSINSDDYVFYFKLVYTNRTKNYRINPDFTINEFLEDVRTRVRRDFDFSDNDSVDIVVAGQFNNINGRSAELAPALKGSDTFTVKDTFTNKNTSFYIRKLEVREREEEPSNDNNNHYNNHYVGWMVEWLNGWMVEWFMYMFTCFFSFLLIEKIK